MRRRAIVAGVLVAFAMVMGGCATTSPGAQPEPGSEPLPSGIRSPLTTLESGPRHAGPQQPDPFVIVYGDTQLDLHPSTYCYSNGCVDGVDDNPPTVGAVDEFFVRLTDDGFDALDVGLIGDGDHCRGRAVAAQVTELDDGWWSVRPAGPAGNYLVSLFTHGSAGDMAAQLRWTTTADQPLPDATAALVLVVDHDGAPDSYGVELSVRDLSASPVDYAATITTTAANGKSHTFAATASHDCHGEGALFFDGPDAGGKAAAALGDFPFTYRVELTLDGTTYVGTGVYPDDVTAEDSLAVPLTFRPALL